MNKISPSLFFQHIAQKDEMTKGQRAEFLYKNYKWDCNLPESWVNYMIEKGFEREEILSNFIWGYASKNDIFGQPFPLNLNACQMLESVEKEQ